MSLTDHPIIERQGHGITNDRVLASVALFPCIHDVLIATYLRPLSPLIPCFENWYPPTPITARAQQDGLNYVACDDFIFGSFTFHARQPLAECVTTFYRTMFDVLQTHGGFFPLRIWHYVPKLHDGQSSAPYQTLCAARASVLGDVPSMYCASTVIGTGRERGTLYFLGARQAGLRIENPRQANAYCYPSEYVDPPPMFSRALAHDLSGGARLYISGTASIVGHRSCHAGDVLTQLDEIAVNLEAVIAAAAKKIPAFADKTLADLSNVKVYLKQKDDCAKVLTRLRQRFCLRDEHELSVFYGEICRPELLVEVEATVDSVGGGSSGRRGNGRPPGWAEVQITRVGSDTHGGGGSNSEH